MATKTACGAMLLAVAATAAMVYAAPASAGSNGKGKPWLRGQTTAQKTDQGRHGRTDTRLTRRKGCVGKSNGRSACTDREDGVTVWVRDHDDGVLSDGIFSACRPGSGSGTGCRPGFPGRMICRPGSRKAMAFRLVWPINGISRRACRTRRACPLVVSALGGQAVHGIFRDAFVRAPGERGDGAGRIASREVIDCARRCPRLPLFPAIPSPLVRAVGPRGRHSKVRW